MSTIQQLAAQAVAALHKQTRNNGEEFWSFKDGSPEWMTDAAHDAHGDMMPDDWRYEAIRDALLTLQHADDDGSPDDLRDQVSEWADADTDVYNGHLSAWLATNLNRAGYVDDAISEFGWPEQGLFKALAYGQMQERFEIYNLLIDALEAIADDQEGGEA